MFKMMLGVIALIALCMAAYYVGEEFFRKKKINDRINELKAQLAEIEDEKECIKLQEEIDKELANLNKTKSKN